jgi:aminomethyltransferase
LAVGHGVYAFLLNPQGHILADFYAYNRGESLVVDTDQSHVEKVLATFDHYIIMDDVEVANLSGQLTAIGVAGPKAQAVLRAVGLDLPVLAPLQFVDMSWQQASLTMVRGDNAGAESFEIWLAPANRAALQEALVKAGARLAGTAALDLLRIASGVPRYGQDIRERDLPQETGQQQRALNFSKGCYVGQEIVERIRSRGNVHRTFTGFLIDGPLPAPGTKVQAAEGKDVGEITSAASLPLASGERHVALGYIRREAAEKTLQAGEAKVVVAETPFAGVFEEIL